ncbi:protein GOLM2-like isoform X5 [Haliotis asinina]|uniref:protein GOLM2-like isoform X5 n=1 Tax=Haliotis asinina TaxID=109174 RepID=UPI003531AE5B
MTANGRGTMRPQGRTPSFLLIGLLVVMCILGYSYWSVASTSSDQALQIVTLQDEVRMLSTRKMEADKQKEASVDRVGVLEKRNAGLVAEMQEKLKAVESVKSELGRKEDELRNANTEVDNKGAALTKCEQDFNGIKEELQKLKEETESLKGNMDKKPAQCDQNACEEPIKNILTVLVNSLGRQQIIATLQSNGIDSNKFIPAEAGQNAGSNSNLQPFNQGGQSPYNQGQNPAGQNPAGQLQVQNPPQNPVDQKQPQNPANQQQPQNPANQQQPQNPANQQPQNPADQQQPQNPADQQQPQNPANQQQPQNPANQQPQNPGDQQLPQNPADQPQQGLNVVPQPNLNQDGNPGDKDPANQEDPLRPAAPLFDGTGRAIPLLVGDGDNVVIDPEDIDDKEEEHKEEDPKLKFEPKDLKHPSDLEQDEDAIDRMKDNMALEDRKPDGSYKIEESEGI